MWRLWRAGQRLYHSQAYCLTVKCECGSDKWYWDETQRAATTIHGMRVCSDGRASPAAFSSLPASLNMI
jgi:hypothetical protein